MNRDTKLIAILRFFGRKIIDRANMISQDGVQSGCSELCNNNDDFTSNHATTHGKSTLRIQASER